MKHNEFIREIPGSKTAAMFVHGILNTPNHFNDMVSMVPDGCSVFNILFDGHGVTANDFSNTSMSK